MIDSSCSTCAGSTAVDLHRSLCSVTGRGLHRQGVGIDRKGSGIGRIGGCRNRTAGILVTIAPLNEMVSGLRGGFDSHRRSIVVSTTTGDRTIVGIIGGHRQRHRVGDKRRGVSGVFRNLYRSSGIGVSVIPEMFMGVDCATLLDVVPFVEVVQAPLAIRT